MDIREITEADFDSAFYLSSQAFAEGTRDDSRMRDPNRGARHGWGVWDEDGLQSSAYALYLENYMGERSIVSLGGVAGVTCHAAKRGRGYANACLLHLLGTMRDKGQVVSTLFPFHWGFYQTLGWDWVGKDAIVKVPAHLLPNSPETELVRAGKESDRAGINACYERYSKGYRGMVVRDDKVWNRILKDTDKDFTYVYVYERDGQIDGYIAFTGWKKKTTKLRDFVATSPQAYAGLLGLLRRHAMQVKKFEWPSPINDQLYNHVVDWDFETEVWPLSQARIVDVKGALEAWHPDPEVSGTVVIEVADDQCDWNRGAWRLEIENGDIHAERTSESAQVSMHIRQLAQGYFGTPTLDEVRAAGKVSVSDEGAYRTLRGALDGPPMWTNDFF